MDENQTTAASPSFSSEPGEDVSPAAAASMAPEPVLSAAANPSEQPVDPIPDSRLYVLDHEDWDVHIKRDSERVYCYSKHPGQDWFHLILNGEIYLTRQHEKYCLRCALRMGFLTEDRLFWQHRVPRRRNQVL